MLYHYGVVLLVFPTVLASKCYKDIVTGPCEGDFLRYAFQSEVGKCVRFVYGGCKGNDNNFMSLRECEYQCAGRSKAKTVAAMMSGTVEADEAMFREAKRDAKKFDVNHVNLPGAAESGLATFDGEVQVDAVEFHAALFAASYASYTSRCAQPIRRGPCIELLQRWAYNGSHCVLFTYSGCQGNDNKFYTLKDCETECIRLSESTIAGMDMNTEALVFPDSFPSLPIVAGTIVMAVTVIGAMLTAAFMISNQVRRRRSAEPPPPAITMI